MKTGRHWNYEKNEPDQVLVKFLEEKLVSIKNRIYEDSGLEVEPVYYCAGYVEPEGCTVYPYNLTKLLYYILQAVPAKKRLSIYIIARLRFISMLFLLIIVFPVIS